MSYLPKSVTVPWTKSPSICSPSQMRLISRKAASLEVLRSEGIVSQVSHSSCPPMSRRCPTLGATIQRLSRPKQREDHGSSQRHPAASRRRAHHYPFDTITVVSILASGRFGIGICCSHSIALDRDRLNHGDTCEFEGLARTLSSGPSRGEETWQRFLALRPGS
jgi:hypothetical protein